MSHLGVSSPLQCPKVYVRIYTRASGSGVESPRRLRLLLVSHDGIFGSLSCCAHHDGVLPTMKTTKKGKHRRVVRSTRTVIVATVEGSVDWEIEYFGDLFPRDTTATTAESRGKRSTYAVDFLDAD